MDLTADAMQAEAAVPAVAGAMGRVLVVDDDDMVRAYIRVILEGEGYSVLEAGSGEDALTLFHDLHPDFVLMDEIMPGLSGRETTQRLKRQLGGSHVPVIFLTSKSDTQTLSDCLSAGGDDFLAKPFNDQVLKAKLHSHQRIRRLHLQLAERQRLLEEFRRRSVRESQIAEKIFHKAVNERCDTDRHIRTYISPMAIFNGDLILIRRKADGGVYLIMADFTGHGLSAAIGGLPLADCFYHLTEQGCSEEEIVAGLNAVVGEILPDDMFCALALLELDAARSRLSVWNGGIPDIYVVNRQSGLRLTLAPQHMPLGILSGSEFDSRIDKVTLVPGDRIYCYSDGLVETMDSDGRVFGEDRLQRLLEEHHHSADLFHNIIGHVLGFRGMEEQKDDLSLIEIECMVGE